MKYLSNYLALRRYRNDVRAVCIHAIYGGEMYIFRDVIIRNLSVISVTVEHFDHDYDEVRTYHVPVSDIAYVSVDEISAVESLEKSYRMV
ncbi:hypothetical protein AHIS1_p084 [Acaryochloris phage A-HIS1]|nr:hypothetical protein AHIS1_p084 [Acaryochloris phage A-HIS1]